MLAPLSDSVILSVCIPTYNRPECVQRCLGHFQKVIAENGLEGKVEVCISDNAQDERTKNVVSSFRGKLKVKYSQNPKNLGYDRNVILAMSMGSGRFVQLAGDEFMFYGPALRQTVELLEQGKGDIVLFDDDRLFPGSYSMPGMVKDSREVWGKVLSYKWILKRSITHIDFLIISNKAFRGYLDYLKGRGLGPDMFYDLIFSQFSFFFYAFKHSEKVLIIDKAYDPAPNVPKNVGVYFPSDDARVFYNRYFFEFRACHAAGILDGKEYAKFKRSYFFSSINHLLRIRTHMYPKIYEREIGEVLTNVKGVENEYSGIHRAALAAMRRILFIGFLPYHLLYVGFVFFRNNILRKPRMSAIELYERTLEGKTMEGNKLYKTDF